MALVVVERFILLQCGLASIMESEHAKLTCKMHVILECGICMTVCVS